MCVVEIKGSPKLNAACVYPVTEGMEVITNSKRIFELLLDKVKHFDYEFQAACVKEQNFEKLEMYVMELLMGIK